MPRTKKGHSLSSHPRHRITVRSSQRSVLLTRTFCYCIVQENTFSFGQDFALFSSNLGTPEFHPQGYQDNRTVRADTEIGARDSQNRNRNSTTPLSLNWRGGPGRVHLPSSGHFKESLLGRSASTNRTGGPDNNQLSTLSENSGLYF